MNLQCHRVGRMTFVWSWGVVVAGALLASSPARSETIRARDMLRGSDITAEACGQIRHAVWVTAYGHGFCMRYYVSVAGGSDAQPVVYLSGDKPTFDTLHENIRSGKHRSRARKNSNQERRAKDIDTADLADQARKLSRRTGATAIILGRMGLDGSSGHHGLRRTMLELRVTNAALDAIKERHGYRGFHLFGNSGGSTLIGGLLALRGDIGCAVPGSGRLALLTKAKPVDTPELERFDPVKMIPRSFGTVQPGSSCSPIRRTRWCQARIKANSSSGSARRAAGSSNSSWPRRARRIMA